MSAIVRTEQIDGWTLGFDTQGDEPRIRDLELGARLGYARPVEIRKVVRRLSALPAFGALRVIATVATTSGGRPGHEFWLTEAQALKVIARSETDLADKILDEVIAVYLAWRRGHLVPATDANTAAIGDSPTMRDRLQLGARRVVLARGYSLQKVYGYLRRVYHVGSPLMIAQHRIDDALGDLEKLETCVHSLFSARAERLLATEKRRADRQLRLGPGKEWN